MRCRCRGLGAPEIIDPCIRELVDCLNRHGVETLSSCCGHAVDPGDIILQSTAVEPLIRDGIQDGWILKLNIKPMMLPYQDDLGWKDPYPQGGKNAKDLCPVGAIEHCPVVLEKCFPVPVKED